MSSRAGSRPCPGRRTGAWRPSRAGLVVGKNGRVAFGNRELVAAGQAVRLQILEFVAGEDTPAFAVVVELRDGHRRQLPVPGLGFWGTNRGFLDHDAAMRFARLVADPLGVKVKTDPSV